MTLKVTFAETPTPQERRSTCIFTRQSPESDWVRYGPESIAFDGSVATLTVSALPDGAQAKATCGTMASDIITITIVPRGITITSMQRSTDPYVGNLEVSGNSASIADLDEYVTLEYSEDGVTFYPTHYSGVEWFKSVTTASYENSFGDQLWGEKWFRLTCGGMTSPIYHFVAPDP